jgi:hypothetical protein
MVENYLFKNFYSSLSIVGQTLQVFTEAKQIAQNASSYWLHKFQAFIFALLK